MVDDRAGAEAEFRGILALDQGHRLDPGIFSPAVVQFYQEVRTRTGMAFVKQADDPPKRPEKRTEPRAAPPPAVVRTATDDRAPLALAFIPFGVGQFANGDAALGITFVVAEVGLLGSTAVFFALFRGVADRHGTEVGGTLTFDDQEHADEAGLYQSLYLATFYSGIGVVAIGVVQAIIAHALSAPSEPLALQGDWRHTSPAGPDGASAGLDARAVVVASPAIRF